MTSPFDLSGKIAFVTGGASGIGVGIAQVLAEAGAQVIIADLDSDNGQRVEAELGNAAFIEVDLADEASITGACAETIARFGSPWILVNNAGLQNRELLLEATVDHWERTNAVNARAPMLLIRELARAMVAKGDGGRIINVASCVLRGQVIKGLSAYASSKGAIAALTRSSAFELAEHGITVNTVLPGAVMTPGSIGATGPAGEGPGRRHGLLSPLCDPRDIGAAVAFFASPAARYITNQELAVDAGFSLS